MRYRRFGRTGLKVSILGFGAMQIGDPIVSEVDAARMLNQVLDAGVNLIDTARGYKLSEERIGRHVAQRRDEFVLSTKCGYSIPGCKDWTGRCITRGVDEALRRMRTDRIDIMHLHSCPLATLKSGVVVDALARMVKAGKVRVAAYSGENDARQHAIASGRFGSIQTSISICDQRVIREALPIARKRGLGVIAKRPLANAFWRFKRRPKGDYCEPYWKRARTMGLSPGRLAWDEYALRFAAFLPGVHTCIAGTADIKHLRRNIALLANGPLPRGVQHTIISSFKASDRDWAGQV